MHMADALITPLVGGVMWAVSAGIAAKSIKNSKTELTDNKIPLMGIAGAFVFAAQMINFTIPMTGSSGHIGGGLLLAALLGPSAGFITMGAILLIQALFFGDGGILAFGCNWFNMGLFSCFLAYPLIFKKMCNGKLSRGMLMLASVIASVIGLQFGAASVVVQTVASGVTELPFSTFLLFMQPIHLAIGIVEGLITGAILIYVHNTRPELLKISLDISKEGTQKTSYKKLLVVLMAATFIVGAIVSNYASSFPDGLEWSMEKTAGISELEQGDAVHSIFAKVQEGLAFLPDYGFKGEDDHNLGTSVSGIVGTSITLGTALLIGVVIKRRKKKAVENT